MVTSNCTKCNQAVTLVDSWLCPSCGELAVQRMLTDSFDQANIEFPKIINKLNQIQDSSLSLSDLRLTTIVKLREASMWAAFQVKSFPDLMMKASSPIPIYLKTINGNISDSHIKQLVSNFDLMNRASFLTMFLFQIEVLLNGINSVLPNQSSRTNYNALIKHVLRELSISDPNDSRYDILNVPALVRNCLHAEGKHTRDDNHGEINGVLFRFTRGQTHSYGSWEHTCFFCNKAIDVIEEILNSNFVKNTLIPKP